MKPIITRITITAALLLAPLTRAATKAEYRAASVAGMREAISFGRAKVMVSKVLEGAKDKPITVVGRGEIMMISRLLLAGKDSNDQELLPLARDIVLACNKAALEGYDTPEKTSLEQEGFALRELALAVPQLKALKLLEGRDAERADEMLKKAADFLPTYMPKPGDGNIAQRYALGIASVCQMFPNDPRVPQWKAWAEIPFLSVLQFPHAEGLPGSKRRVLEKQGARWKWAADTQPFNKIQTVEISEDSSAYEALTIVTWMGIARLIGREAEIKTPAVEAFIDRFYQQLMPIGILPTYGDANWNGSPDLWIGIFEWAGATFHQPKYRAAADAIFRYQLDRGLPVGDLTEAVEYADESIKPQMEAQHSILLQRVSGRGERIPDKVILRGNESQAYVMMQATESLGVYASTFNYATGTPLPYSLTWLTAGLGLTTAGHPQRVLAENVIAMVLLPRLSFSDPRYSATYLTDNFVYNSRLYLDNSAAAYAAKTRNALRQSCS